MAFVHDPKTMKLAAIVIHTSYLRFTSSLVVRISALEMFVCCICLSASGLLVCLANESFAGTVFPNKGIYMETDATMFGCFLHLFVCLLSVLGR